MFEGNWSQDFRHSSPNGNIAVPKNRKIPRLIRIIHGPGQCFTQTNITRRVTSKFEKTDCRSYVRQNLAVTQSDSPRSGERSYGP